jgi:hypothetical protein
MRATPARGFARWLAEATQGLPREAATQARAELIAHYEDAVEEHQCQGKGRHEAHAAALADLGDADTVRRMLRRVHLSTGERWVAALMTAIQALWRARDIAGPLLFGLLVVVATMMDYTHTVAYRRHVDPMVPVAFAFVLTCLLVERRIRLWCYAPLGYVLAGVWGWLFFAGPGWLSSVPFWNQAGPLVLPGALLTALAILGIRYARRSGGLRIPVGAWILACLWLGFGMLDPDYHGAVTSQASVTRAVASGLVYALWTASYAFPAVGVGLFGARDGGLAAVMIPLAMHHGASRAYIMPGYPSHLFASSSAPVLTGLQAVMIYLWPVALFIVTPLWVRHMRSARSRTAALLMPAVTLIAGALLLGLLGQHDGFEGMSQVAWAKYALSVGRSATFLLLAVVVYGQFEGRARSTVAPSAGALKGLEQPRGG